MSLRKSQKYTNLDVFDNLSIGKKLMFRQNSYIHYDNGIKVVSNNESINLNNLVYSTDNHINLHSNELLLDNTRSYKRNSTRDRKFRIQIPNDNILCNKVFEKIFVSTNGDNSHLYINFSDDKNQKMTSHLDMINTHISLECNKHYLFEITPDSNGSIEYIKIKNETDSKNLLDYDHSHNNITNNFAYLYISSYINNIEKLGIYLEKNGNDVKKSEIHIKDTFLKKFESHLLINRNNGKDYFNFNDNVFINKDGKLFLGYNHDGFKNVTTDHTNELYVFSGTKIGGSLSISGDIVMKKGQKLIFNKGDGVQYRTYIKCDDNGIKFITSNTAQNEEEYSLNDFIYPKDELIYLNTIQHDYKSRQNSYNVSNNKLQILNEINTNKSFTYKGYQNGMNFQIPSSYLPAIDIVTHIYEKDRLIRWWPLDDSHSNKEVIEHIIGDTGIILPDNYINSFKKRIHKVSLDNNKTNNFNDSKINLKCTSVNLNEYIKILSNINNINYNNDNLWYNHIKNGFVFSCWLYLNKSMVNNNHELILIKLPILGNTTNTIKIKNNNLIFNLGENNYTLITNITDDKWIFVTLSFDLIKMILLTKLYCQNQDKTLLALNNILKFDSEIIFSKASFNDEVQRNNIIDTNIEKKFTFFSDLNNRTNTETELYLNQLGNNILYNYLDDLSGLSIELENDIINIDNNRIAYIKPNTLLLINTGSKIDFINYRAYNANSFKIIDSQYTSNIINNIYINKVSELRVFNLNNIFSGTKTNNFTQNDIKGYILDNSHILHNFNIDTNLPIRNTNGSILNIFTKETWFYLEKTTANIVDASGWIKNETNWKYTDIINIKNMSNNQIIRIRNNSKLSNTDIDIFDKDGINLSTNGENITQDVELYGNNLIKSTYLGNVIYTYNRYIDKFVYDMGLLREDFKYMMDNKTIDNVYISDVRIYKNYFDENEILNLYQSTQKNYNISTNLNHSDTLNFFNMSDGVKEINIGNYYKCVSGNDTPLLYTGLTYKRIFNETVNHSVFFMGYSYDEINNMTSQTSIINNNDIATLNIKGNKFNDNTEYNLLYNSDIFKDITHFDLSISQKKNSISDFIKDNNNENVSLNCNDLIISKGYLVSSDKRIKTLIQDISMNDLKNNFKKIELKMYKFKDKFLHGKQNKIGVIADELEKIFPYLVKKTKGFVPTIYRLCEFRYTKKILYIYLNDDELLQLNIGDKIKILLKDNEYIIEIKNKNNLNIQCLFDNNHIHTYSNIFVYGKFVTDIKHVSNDDLLFLTVGICSNLINENQNINNRLDNIDAQLKNLTK